MPKCSKCPKRLSQIPSVRILWFPFNIIDQSTIRLTLYTALTHFSHSCMYHFSLLIPSFCIIPMCHSFFEVNGEELHSMLDMMRPWLRTPAKQWLRNIRAWLYFHDAIYISSIFNRDSKIIIRRWRTTANGRGKTSRTWPHRWCMHWKCHKHKARWGDCWFSENWLLIAQRATILRYCIMHIHGSSYWESRYFMYNACGCRYIAFHHFIANQSSDLQNKNGSAWL